jgi:hypothetical protein
MKIIISFTLLIVFSISSFCQSTPNDLPTVKTDYLKKSKNQKIAAWVLLGGGIILETTTPDRYSKSYRRSDIWPGRLFSR